MSIGLEITPAMIAGRDVHIAGLGTLGGRYCGALVSMLAPFVAQGDLSLHLWDDDVVEERNLRNQGFLPEHIGMLKVEARRAQARAAFPSSTLVIVPHAQRVSAQTELSGIVLSGVDSMRERRVLLAAAEAAAARAVATGDHTKEVAFFGDGRLGLDGGKAYGFDPNNPLHLLRYKDPVHNHEDPLPQETGPCKRDMPSPHIADITAGHVIARLAQWLHFEQGASDSYMHCVAFHFVPIHALVAEYWDEE